MAIKCRRRSTTHPLGGRSVAKDGRREHFLSREEWAVRPGEEILAAPLRQGDRGAAGLRPDQAMERPRGRAVAQHLREVLQTFVAFTRNFAVPERLESPGARGGKRIFQANLVTASPPRDGLVGRPGEARIVQPLHGRLIGVMCIQVSRLKATHQRGREEGRFSTCCQKPDRE
jgi:hypothetical protein